MDRDQVFAHGDLLDDRPQHFLLLDISHLLGGFIQSAKETFHGVAELDPAFVFDRSQMQILLFFLQGADFLFELG